MTQTVREAVRDWALHGKGVRHISVPDFWGSSQAYMCGAKLTGWTPTPFSCFQAFVEKAAPPMCEACKELAILRTLGDV
jgi:hypothetical protein